MLEELKKIDIKATHIIFLADIHFGKHVNSEEWQDNMRDYFYNFFIPKIKEIKSKLNNNEKLICIILGDTYDDRKAIDINVNNLSIDVMEDISKEVEIYIINGNHDLSKKTNKGNSSLRSIEYIPNIFVITDPTMLNINYDASKHCKLLAIPYLGDHTLENEYLAKYSSKSQYALMHTDIANMKMDNGMMITGGVNSKIYKGTILSGHIHKRQESEKVIYVGSPYHMSKADIGNDKGLYVLNIDKKELSFIKNDYSPIYHSIYMSDYCDMSDEERKAFFNNNYNYVIIDEDSIPQYKKKYDIYDLGAGTTAKMVKPIINKHKQTIEIDENKDYQEMSISELISESIQQLDLEDDAKMRLTNLSNEYLKDAESEIVAD